MKKNYNYIFAFTIPFVLVFIISAMIGCYPLSLNKSIQTVDIWSQYIPFTKNFWNSLVHGDYMLFTNTIGGGMSLEFLYAYYGLQPLGFISLFGLNDILVGLLMLAIYEGIASVFMMFYLERKNKSEWSLFAGLSYAFCGWAVAYSSEIIWMYAFCVFPLIMYFYEKMMENRQIKDCAIYSLLLASVIISNFFIGFIICIFLFLSYLLEKNKNVKFFIFSIIAGIIALPVIYIVLKNILASPDLSQPQVKSTIWMGIKTFLTGIFPVNVGVQYGFAEYACYAYSNILFLLYAICYFFKKSENRTKNLILLIILSISMMFYEVEVLWYGLDAPDGLYRRMSFLFSFIIIRCGYECLSENDENKKLEWKKILVLLLSLAVDLYYNQVSFAFSIVSIVLYYIFRDKKKETCVIFTMELFLMTFYGFCENGYTEVPCANLTVEREEKQNTERTSAIFEENPNISLVTKEYNTFSVFVSGCNLNVCNLFFSLGHLGGNTNYMSNVTLPSSLYTLLGTDTIISDQEEYVPYFVPDEENSDEEQGRYVYQNTRNLPIGYIVPDNMLDYEGTSKNIFENNNELTQLVVGEDIYSDIPFELNDSKLSFTADKDYEEILVSSLFDTATSEAENFYGNVFVYVDGEKICTKKTNANTSGYTYTIYLHDIKKGDKVLVDYSEMYFETTTASVEEFHKDAFDKFYNVLSQEVLENTSYSNGIYAGQITCRKDSTLMITVPYDVCLKAYVDGEETEIMPVLKDALCGINITAGEHNIVLSYEDDILPYTMGISLIFITFNVLLLTFHKRFDKKKML